MTRDDQLNQLFELAVDENADAMYRVAWRLTGEQQWATDLVQETYLQAWQGLGSLRDRTRLRSWMFGILHRQYLKQLRNKTRIRFASFDESSIPPVESGGSESELTDRREQVQQAIGQPMGSCRMRQPGDRLTYVQSFHDPADCSLAAARRNVTASDFNPR